MAAYASKEYWNKRYENDPEPFDWFQRYDMFKKELLQHVHKGQRVLIVGCGNSTKLKTYVLEALPEGLYSDGIQSLTCVDFSNVVIDQMQLKHSDKQGLQFKEADVTDMSDFEDSSFDIVIDKATMDSMLCGDSANKNVASMVREVYRVLRPKGKFIIISHAKKQQRMPWLSKTEFKWTINTVKLSKPSFEALPLDDDASYHYMFICEKP